MKTLVQVSDLHLEFSKQLEINSWPDADYLALTGDIGVGMSSRDFIEKLISSKKYQHIFYVPGNHEYYNKCKEDIDLRWLDFAAEHNNFHYMIGQTFFEDGDYLFAGCTLWTNIDTPEEQAYIQYSMNDYNMIRSIQAFDPRRDDFYRKVTDFDIKVQSTWAQGSPATRITYVDGMFAKPPTISVKLTNCWHQQDVFYLEEAVKEAKVSNKKLVVFTHHTPSILCLNEKHAGGYLDKGYYTNLEWLMKDVYLWGCGHTHNRMDSAVNGCRLIMCGRGYVFGQGKEELPGFQPKVTVL